MRVFGTLSLLVVAAACLPGCGARRLYVQTPPEPAPLYVVEIVGGEVATSRPDGQPWDLEGRESPPRSSGLKLLTPLGSLSINVGSTRQPPVMVPGAPDAAVSLQFEGRLIEAPPSRDSFTPGWRYRFLIDPLLDPDGSVSIQVDDDDGDHQESMGVRTIDMRDLLSQQSMDLGPFGSVKHLQVTVSREPVDRFPAFETRPIAVQADTEGWVNTGLEVLSGMQLAIAAEGRVRLSRMTTGYWGPEGVTDPQLIARWQSHNVEGFEGTRHGALIACIVDPVSQIVTQRLTVADGLLTRVSGSGILLLGVNDTDIGNNAGTFQVRVGGGVREQVVAAARPVR